MKYFVITIMDNFLSQKVADRCIASAKKYGIEVNKWPAVTPRDPNFTSLVKDKKLVERNFESGHSKKENALACFLSHLSLWEYCVKEKTDICILEHDAVFVDRVPTLLGFNKVITLGQPSYGVYNTPTQLGTQPLTQKEYFKGAHAYAMRPTGAKELLSKVSDYSRPTDVYLNVINFDFLEEYYPWPVKVDDNFSTIQHTQGCIAKHNYQKGIELVEA
jgi:GR25 family glycosyltransferase involved in LPS biosynthesis